MVPTRSFKSGVLETVKELGGQFARARLTQVPGGKTPNSQRNQIKFWTTYRRESDVAEKLNGPAVGSEVIYLPRLVENSASSTCYKVNNGRVCVQDILNRLPEVEGLRWIVGNLATVCRVLANHRKATRRHLLPNVYTWTTDNYKLSEGLGGAIEVWIVGECSPDGVGVITYPLRHWDDDIGLFVLGVPV